MRALFAEKKGVAELNFYLGIIATLFVIGILVMVFQLAGSELESTASDDVSRSAINATRTALGASTSMFPTFTALGGIIVVVALLAILLFHKFNGLFEELVMFTSPPPPRA